MEFRLLGPLEVVDRDRALALGGRKQRSLLAVLLLHANDVVATEQLIDKLWGAEPPATVAKSIQIYVSRLRKQLGEGRLITRVPGYVLHVAASELDLARFERLVADAAAAEPERAAERLREALALWRGPALADLAYEPFTRAEIARLEELRLAALEQLFDAELARGRHAQVAGALEALVNDHPLRERPRGQLMLCLYRSGRQAEALETYQAARRALVEELGIDPGRRLRELHQAILEQDPVLDPAPAANTGQGAFVGRAPELSALVAGLDDAFAGRGRLFLLAGEPGIGKSRLAEELVAHGRARGARMLVGRCWEAGGAPAYWPWVQVLRTYARDTDPDLLRTQLGAGAADLAQVVPELRRHLPDLPEPPALTPEAARFHMFDATAEFLRNASESRPILLVLDDLHAADAPSLLLLQFLARELGSMRVLVVGAFRDVDPSPRQALAAMLAEVAREPVTQRLRLAGLSEPELADYVERSAAAITSPPLIAALHEETEGNPLFAGEIVRLLALEGVRPEAVRLAIPQSVRDVIARRLSHLSGNCNRALVLASVIGREFALDALARLAEISEEQLLDLLDEAMAAGVVADVPGDARAHLRFAHVLIRDTLYDGLSTARRVSLHRRLVGVLEALYGDSPGPHIAELAHHSLAGRDVDNGVRYARRAGDRALSLLAYEEAARLYESALAAIELDPSSDERTRCELLLSLGDAESLAGNTAHSKSAFLDAAGIARRIGLPHALARAAAAYGGRMVYARAEDDERLLPLLEEGLAGLGADEVELRVRLLARLAGALRKEPSRARRDALSREAVELARRSGSPAALAHALDGRAIAIVASDTITEIDALARELLGVAERAGDRERVLHGHLHRLGPLLTLGEVEEADAALQTASAIAHELRQPAHLWDVYGAHAMLALAQGRLSEAEVLTERARELGERAQPDIAIPVCVVQRYTLCDLRSSLEDVEPAVRELADARPSRPVFRCVLAQLDARMGRLTDSKRTLDDLAEDEFAALPFDQEWLFGMSLLAETSALLGDATSAAVLYELLVPWAAFCVVDQCEGVRGSMARYLGILAAATRRWRAAELHFGRALAMNERMGARPWLAHTQHDFARMLVARDGRGDRERARELAAAALATYHDIGMESYATSAAELQADVAVRRPAPNP